MDWDLDCHDNVGTVESQKLQLRDGEDGHWERAFSVKASGKWKGV